MMKKMSKILTDRKDYQILRGGSSWLASLDDSQEVAGSSPAPATKTAG